MGGGLGHTRFVGRAAELARLRASLREATEGRPRVAILAGEAGVGKTRLLREFLDTAHDDRMRVLEGACLQLGSAGPPYAPVVAVLRSLARSIEPGALPAILGPGRAALARLVPEFLERAPAVSSGPPDPTSQVRLFELVSGTVERLARSAPLVVAVEDVHWSDVSSRELLDFLVRGLRGDEHLLLVLTLRTDALGADEPTRAWMAELSRLPAVDRIDLAPLSRAAIAEIVGDVLGHPPEPDFVGRVVERANGNPFLTEELVAAGDRGDGMPEHLREILLARLVPLADPARAVVRAAAAGGRRVDDGLLADALGLDDAQIHAALREAVANGVLVRADAARPGPAEYVFRHALLRDAIDDELFPRERARLHAAYARALEARAAKQPGAVEPAELAHHWDLAGEPGRALPAYVRAGRAATGVYAWAEARRSFERALELWGAVERPEGAAFADLRDLLIETANVCGLQGDYERAVALARRALERVDPSTDPRRVADIRESLRWFLWEAGDRAAAGAEVAEALRVTPAEPPSSARARALAHEAGLEMFAGHPGEALARADEAIRVARAASALPEEALALGVAGWAVATLGDVDGGIVRFREAMRIARLLGGVEGIALGYTNLTGVLDRAGRIEEALEVAREGFAEVERFGLARTFGAPLLAYAARTLFHLGRWDEAERSLAEATSLASLPSARQAVLIEVGRLAAARGRFEESRLALDSAADVERSLGGTVPDSALLRARAELAAWSGDVAEGRRAVDEALARPLADPAPDPALAWVAALGLRIEADAAEVARAARDRASVEDAEARAAAIERWLEGAAAAAGSVVAVAGSVDTAAGSLAAMAGGEARPQEAAGSGVDPRVRGIVDLCRAERDRLVGRPAAGSWRAVADDWAAMGRPLPAAYARFREGAAHLAVPSGRPAARAALTEAARTARALGAAPLSTEIDRLARAARLDLGGAPDTDEEAATRAIVPAAAGLGLTPRELEVLHLVAAGWSNPDIAEALGISPKTASVHVSNILGKLGVTSRVEAAVLATRIGLGSRDGPSGAPGAAPGVVARVHRTFMFTDIVRSTSLIEAIGDRPWADLRRWHDRTLRAAFQRHGGDEVDHAGDGFFIAFRSAADAVGCAVEIQRVLAEHRRAAGFAPSVRIGLHAGEADHEGAAYGGVAVHVAARIAARADGDEILASEPTAREARVAGAVGPVEAHLPGISEPVAIVALAW